MNPSRDSIPGPTRHLPVAGFSQGETCQPRLPSLVRPSGLRPMAKKEKWIQGAIKHPGALKRKAAAKGMTPSQFCAQPKSALSPQSVRQCALLKTLNRVRPE